MITLFLSFVMMAGLFLMLWGAVGFVQNKRFFTSAPKAVQDAVLSKEERFKGQHMVGWIMLIFSLVLMGGALIFGGVDGIRNGFDFWKFFVRFTVMLLLLKAFDILFFDFYLLCRSGFFARYYPETKAVCGPHLFGYNWKSHVIQIVLMVLGSLLMAWVCTLI